MIFDLDGEPLDSGLLGQSYGHSPTLEHVVLFETEIEVMRASVVFLDNKSWLPTVSWLQAVNLQPLHSICVVFVKRTTCNLFEQFGSDCE